MQYHVVTKTKAKLSDGYIMEKEIQNRKKTWSEPQITEIGVKMTESPMGGCGGHMGGHKGGHMGGCDGNCGICGSLS